MAAASRLRDPLNIADVCAAPHSAADTAVKVAATAFKLDLMKRHAETGRPDLARASAALKVHVAKADIGGLTADRAATGAYGLTLELFDLTRALAELIQAVAAIMPISALAMVFAIAVAGAEMQTAIAGLDSDGSTASLAMPFVSKGRSGEEQGRR